MDLLFLLFVFPLAIFIGTIILSLKYSFLGATISSVIVTAYFHILAMKMNGYGNPTGYKSNISVFTQLRDDMIVLLVSLVIFSAIVFIKKQIK